MKLFLYSNFLIIAIILLPWSLYLRLLVLIVIGLC